MNNTISTTVGIDTVIQEIQTELYNGLSAEWNGNIDAYGRVYKNIQNDGKIKPRWYVGDKEYSDVYYNDNFSCVYCFIDDDNHKTEDEFIFTSKVNIVFMVDLKQLKPSEVDRADSEVQRDVLNLLRKEAFNRYTVTGITKGIKNVFRGFDISKISFSDEQPFHCFSVNIDLYYEITENCS